MLKSYVEAIRETTAEIMRSDDRVYIMGEGVPDPKAVFGTTEGLLAEFGDNRVFDMPVSENGLTGVCIGTAVQGMKPIMVHQRIDFTLYAMDQIVNNAAKWYSMYGGNGGNVSMVIRCIIGRGWGQGNQHSQNLSGLYASIPGLKVVMPSNAKDAKGLLVSAVKDPGPVLYIEHRWLHGTKSNMGDEEYKVPIGKANILRDGSSLTIVSWSYMVIEAMEAAGHLEKYGLACTVIDLRTIRPLDMDTIRQSVEKTKNLLIVDESWSFNSLGGEIISTLFEEGVKFKGKRLNLPDCYAPSTPALTKDYYPRAYNIVEKALDLLKITPKYGVSEPGLHDVPNPEFTGPF